MSENQLIPITESDLQKGIDKGKYREDGILIRNVDNGQIVKVIKNPELSKNKIPSTFIQVNNTTVYHTDITPILKFISESRDAFIFEDLEEKYDVILDYLHSYCVYNKNLESLNDSCLQTSVSFDKRIKRFIKKINISDIENLEVSNFMYSLDSYIRVLFVYIVSTYLMHKSEFAKDKVISNKIESFETTIKGLYEQLLAESNVNKEGTTIIPMKSSLYTMYLLHEDYNILEIEKIVKHDSRFSSALDVISFFKKHFRKGSLKPTQHYNSPYEQETVASISVVSNEIPANSKRNKLAKKLRDILEDINKLKDIKNEIITMEKIDPKYILDYSGLNLSSE